MDLHGEYVVKSADDADQNIFGFASVSVHKDGTVEVDHQDDIIYMRDLELAAYDFVVEARGSGEDHNGLDADAVLIESMAFTTEKMEKMGLAPDALPQSWWVGFHIPDRAAYERAKDKGAFSIEGTAVREPV